MDSEEDATTLEERVMDMAMESESGNLNEAEMMKIYTDMFEERSKKVEEKRRNLVTSSAMPENFLEFNTIAKINLLNKKEIDSMAFKMAAFDIIENSQAYNSNTCAYDLYYTGYDAKDIPEDIQDRLHVKFVSSYRFLNEFKKRIIERIEKSQLEEDIEEVRGEAEKCLEIEFDFEEMILGK